MTTSDWVQLFSFFIVTIGGVFLLLKSWQAWIDGEVKKVDIKSKEAIQLSKDHVEIAKNTTLSTSQAIDIIREYNEMKDVVEDLKKELENSKESSEEKISYIKEAIERVQRLIEHQTNSFTDFLSSQVKLNKL